MKPRDKHNEVVPLHLEESEIIAYLDGEMLQDELAEARLHLDSCWSCRGRLSSVQSSIEAFLRVRRDDLLPAELPPSGPAVEQFRKRLAAHASAPAMHSSFLRNGMGRIQTYFEKAVFSKRESSWAPALVLKLASVSIIGAAVIYFALVSNKVVSVTATELLQRAETSSQEQLKAAPLPVIHQKLSVKRKSANQPAGMSVGLEIWNEPGTPQFRRTVNQNLTPVAAADTKLLELSITTVAELEKIYEANRMDWRQPLSSFSYAAWRSSVPHQHEEINRFTRADGIEVWTLKTVAALSYLENKITEGTLVVRASDWHPIEVRWQVNGPSGIEEYQLIETSFEVVARASLSPTFFAEKVRPDAASNNNNSIAAKSPAAKEASPSHVAATADLEIEVLRLLNVAAANLGEQISVTRTSDDRLYVQGVVDTVQRKNELLATLRPVMKNPAVAVNISTVQELAQQNSKSTTVTIQSGTIRESATIPVYQELRAHLIARGVAEDKVDDNVRQTAAQMMSRSRQALRHAWAIRNISSRFRQSDFQQLSPDARLKWLNMVQQHAAVIQRETQTLRRELGSIFSDMSHSGSSDLGQIKSEAELAIVLARLVDACAGNDGAIRVAFTVSSTTTVSGLQKPQFWQSLRMAEELAARTQTAAEKLKDSPRQ